MIIQNNYNIKICMIKSLHAYPKTYYYYFTHCDEQDESNYQSH